MKIKNNFIDLHGIHLLDYEPYYSSQRDIKNSLLLSCPVPEVFSQVSKFKKEYKGYIGILPYNYAGFDNSFYFENEQMYRAYSFLTLSDMADSAIPFFAISESAENKKGIENILNKSELKKPFGFKFHSLSSQRPISSLLGSETMDFLNEINGMVLLHTGKDSLSNPNQIYTLAEKYGSATFIAAHLGSLNEQFLNNINNYENVYTDTSILSHLIRRIGKEGSSPEESILELLYKFNLEDKLLFGSDYPWTRIFGTSPEKERSFLLNSNIPETVKEKWLFKTAENILKRSG
ncbi:MAG TPA: amidohydrolase family protein [Caldisericia bacterium]|nr:amidohydrolase family protein [Caldisericia bacterium]